MKLPNWVMPTTWMRETSTRVGDGTNTAFIGLSDIPTPTIGWSTTTLMPSDSSWPRGPTPLSISTCGLPIAPADTMISYARCFLPAESRNTTPCAVGLTFPVLEKKLETYLRHGRTQQHREPLRVRVLEQVRRRAPVAVRVEYRASDLRPVDVIVGESVVRRDAGLDEPIPEGRLPLPYRRALRHLPLDPAVGLAHERGPPGGLADVGVAGAGVEAGVEAAAAAEDAGAGVDDAVLGDEALRGGGGGGVGEGVGEEGGVGDVAVAVGGGAALEEEHCRALREGGSDRAPRGAAADDDVVVVGDGRGLRCILYEGVVWCCSKKWRQQLTV
ncbi:hypothetical protein ACMD2_11986 [Ananas comosus]|uniref:Uncharacterized protein n=1 Tax=Ananas comosus TaxID=4615 RepID=A0A199UWP7_ANACO|nr:hypothetical protein ACMD2_11986 [Ananas comosus]